jgi:hypothetical protein
MPQTPNLLITTITQGMVEQEAAMTQIAIDLENKLTEKRTYLVDNTNAVTVLNDDAAGGAVDRGLIIFSDGSPAPSATVTCTLPTTEFGYLLLENRLTTHDINAGRSGQSPLINIPVGTNALVFSDGVNTLLVARGVSATDTLDWKDSVRAATDAAGTLATSFENGDTIDTSVVLATGDRILLKDQVTGSENGIYIVQATGAPVRATDADGNAEVTAGMACFVSEGTANGNKNFQLTTDDPIVVDTTTLVFAEFAGGGGGGTIETQDEGIQVEAAASILDFVGPGVTATAGGGKTTINIPGPVSGSGGGGMDFIESRDFSGDSVADFLLDASLYDSYYFVIGNVRGSIDATSMFIRTSTDGGSTYDAGASDYVQNGVGHATSTAVNAVLSSTQTQAQINVTPLVSSGTAAGEGGFSGYVQLIMPHLTQETHVQGQVGVTSGAGNPAYFNVQGIRDSDADVDAIRFLFSTGNLASGTITMYGFRNAASAVSTSPWKDSVVAATTADGALATAYENGDTIDDVVLATGDRILLKDQSTGSENGIYTVNASGAPTRAVDADSDVEVTPGMAVFVSEGTANGDKNFQLTTDGPIVVDTTALVFAEFAGAGGGGGSGAVIAGALEFISRQDLSAAASADFTGFDATKYDSYMFVLGNVIPATDPAKLAIRTSNDGGSTYDAGATDYEHNVYSRDTSDAGDSIQSAGNTGDTAIQLTKGNVGGAAGEDGISGTVWVLAPHLAKRTHIRGEVSYHNSIGETLVGDFGGIRDAAEVVDAVRFLFGTGNIESGTITMYGVRNSAGTGGADVTLPHQGALIGLTVDSGAVNYTTEQTVNAWDVAVYDTTFQPDDAGLPQRFWLGANRTFVDGDVTTGTDTIADAGHGFVTGEGPLQLTSSGTLPAGLALATDYWVIRVDDNSFKFATSRALAIAGTAVDITAAAGGGTHTLNTVENIVIPAGIAKVRLRSGIASGDLTATWTVNLQKNGNNDWQGAARQREGVASGAFEPMQLSSPTVEVVEGDRFSVSITTASDTSVTLLDDETWLMVEVVETVTKSARGALTGEWETIQQKTVAAAADVSFDVANDAITWTNYDRFELEFEDVVPGTDNQAIRLTISTDGGATYLAGTTYDFANDRWGPVATRSITQSTAQAFIEVARALGTGAGETLSGKIDLGNLNSTLRFACRAEAQGVDATVQLLTWEVAGFNSNTSAKNGVKLAMASGNLTGKFTLRGRRA